MPPLPNDNINDSQGLQGWWEKPVLLKGWTGKSQAQTGWQRSWRKPQPADLTSINRGNDPAQQPVTLKRSSEKVCPGPRGQQHRQEAAGGMDRPRV